jgi:hypothetical protein
MSESPPSEKPHGRPEGHLASSRDIERGLAIASRAAWVAAGIASLLLLMPLS